MTDKSVMIRWWFILWTMVLGAFALQYYGMFSKLWVADQTHITYAILFIFTILTLFIGALTKKLASGVTSVKKYIEPCWFFAEKLMALGMIGTLIGFMLILGPAFAGVDVSSPTGMKSVIIKVAVGLGTAVSSTLVGLVTSQLAKLQMINLGTLFDEEE